MVQNPPTNGVGPTFAEIPSGAGDLVKETDTASFMQDVIEASSHTPVLVDFWAPWCGPCKSLGPLLEKVVASYGGKVRMVKVNVDENQQLAAQMQVQSIPAVFGFKQGRPVDGFAGALPESQIKQFIDRLLGADAGNPIDEALDQADEMRANDDVATAQQVYQQVLQHDPENVRALAGLLECLLAQDQEDIARDMLEHLPDTAKESPAVASILKRLELSDRAAENALDPAQEAALRARIEADPKDHQARIDLAVALFGAGAQEDAMETLLGSLAIDLKWNDEAARKQLLEFFEALGPTHELTVWGRRRLSSLLFS